MSSEHYQIDEVITVEEEVEQGYFYLENHQFKGPFASSDEAIEAALTQCTPSSTGECRAVYHGSVKTNATTGWKEPMADMHQIEAGASLVAS